MREGASTVVVATMDDGVDRVEGMKLAKTSAGTMMGKI